MKKTINKLPSPTTQPLYKLTGAAGFLETTTSTSGDITNTTTTVLTTTHIWQK